jgi:hypothetical protein
MAVSSAFGVAKLASLLSINTSVILVALIFVRMLLT